MNIFLRGLFWEFLYFKELWIFLSAPKKWWSNLTCLLLKCVKCNICKFILSFLSFLKVSAFWISRSNIETKRYKGYKINRRIISKRFVAYYFSNCFDAVVFSLESKQNIWYFQWINIPSACLYIFDAYKVLLNLDLQRPYISDEGVITYFICEECIDMFLDSWHWKWTEWPAKIYLSGRPGYKCRSWRLFLKEDNGAEKFQYKYQGR